LKGCWKNEKKKHDKIEKSTNVNRYTFFFVMETILLIGVLDEVLEGVILGAELPLVANVLLLMLAVGVLFNSVFALLEKFIKKRCLGLFV
jgi:hypothetical protein